MAQPSTTSQPMIGRYEVVAKLGEGGMAETWLCRLRGTRGFVRRVVVKTLKTEHLDIPEFHTMFTDEARVGAAMEHPSIPRVEELGEHGGLPYMVQEYVEGPSLYQLLKQQRRLGRFDPRLAARIVADVARALDHAWLSTDGDGQPLHVVHRDVSLSNILISVKGQAKLIDFGVARFADRETRTEAGVLKGKLRYMAPEAILEGRVDHGTDLYALGVVLFVLLSGRHAWSGNQDVGERLKGRFPKPSELAEGVPPGLEDIAMSCLAADPLERPAAGRELAERLDAWLLENGGPCTDDEVTRAIEGLFPGGADDWRTNYAVDPSRSFGTMPTVERRGLAPTLLGLIGLSGVGAVVLGVIAVVLLRSPTPAAPEPAPAPAPVADAAAERRDAAVDLLDAAERALAAGDEAEAASQLKAAASLELTDAGLLSRRERLQAELTVATRIRATERLLTVDPQAALTQALQLETEYPGRPAVTELAERAQALATAAHAAPEPTARPVARPAPAAPVAAPAPVAEVEPARRDTLLDPGFGAARPDPAALKDPFGGGTKTDEGLKDPFGTGGR